MLPIESGKVWLLAIKENGTGCLFGRRTCKHYSKNVYKLVIQLIPNSKLTTK